MHNFFIILPIPSEEKDTEQRLSSARDLLLVRGNVHSLRAAEYFFAKAIINL